MRLPRFRVRMLMVAVAALGLLLAGCLSLAKASLAKTGLVKGSNFDANYFAGWACLYAIPLMLTLTLGRRVSPRSLAKFVGKAVVQVLPFAALFGLLCFTIDGSSQPAERLVEAILLTGVTALYVVAFTQIRAVS